MNWHASFGRDAPLRWLVWFGVGLFWHLCAILLSWLLCRGIDLSLLNPLSYSDYGWFMAIAYYCLFLWLWINE